MFVALGSGAVGAAMLYLFVHAFFKALLFLGCGSVIHATEEQEVDELGGLWDKMPITAPTFIIGALAMAGLVPLLRLLGEGRDPRRRAQRRPEHHRPRRAVSISCRSRRST